MPIYRTAYDTLTCRYNKMDKTITAIKKAQIQGFTIYDSVNRIQSLGGSANVFNDIPAFAHPLLVEGSTKNDWAIVIDDRPFGKLDMVTRTFSIRNQIEYKILHDRAVLNLVWLDEKYHYLRDMSPLGMTFYARWISQNVQRRFVLGSREQMELSIMAAYLYYSLFTDDVVFDEREILRISTNIVRGLRVSAEDALGVLDRLEKKVLNGVPGFCEAAEEVIGSVRLKELNPGVLHQIVQSTWFGTNAPELATVSLEHPPTWLALVRAAHWEKAFKNSWLGTTARDTPRDVFTAYNNTLDQLILSV